MTNKNYVGKSTDIQNCANFIKESLEADEMNPHKEHDFEIVKGKRKHSFNCKRCRWKLK